MGILVAWRHPVELRCGDGCAAVGEVDSPRECSGVSGALELPADLIRVADVDDETGQPDEDDQRKDRQHDHLTSFLAAPRVVEGTLLRADLETIVERHLALAPLERAAALSGFLFRTIGAL
jgi:hypothetical protein